MIWKDRAIKQVMFKCQRCGDCCTGPEVVDIYPEDINRLTRKFHTNMESVLSRFCAEHPLGGKRFTLKNLKPCQFYRNGCRIYHYRPIVCRMAPYLVGAWNYCDNDFGDLPDLSDDVIILGLVKCTGLSATEIFRYLKYIGAI